MPFPSNEMVYNTAEDLKARKYIPGNNFQEKR
jgi:hypothetical protein